MSVWCCRRRRQTEEPLRTHAVLRYADMAEAIAAQCILLVNERQCCHADLSTANLTVSRVNRIAESRRETARTKASINSVHPRYQLLCQRSEKRERVVEREVLRASRVNTWLRDHAQRKAQTHCTTKIRSIRKM